MIRIIFLFLLICWSSFSQEKRNVVDFDDVYLDNELLYDSETERLFTGFIHRKRRNGQLIQEDYVKNGVIHYTELFYRRRNRVPYAKYVFNKDNPYVLSQIFKYYPNGDLFEIIYYDYDGRKILEEDFEDGQLIYSCQFDGRRRHGREFCITRACDTTIAYYRNGRRLKGK